MATPTRAGATIAAALLLAVATAEGLGAGGDEHCPPTPTPGAAAFAEGDAVVGSQSGDSASLLQQVLGTLGRAARRGDSARANASTPVCPPPGVQPASGFNITEYIRKSWFVIEQQSVSFQPEPLLCVTATYDLATKKQRKLKVPGFCGDIIIVNNYQQQSSGTLCGSLVDPSTPSALKVAPCFLPTFLAGNYWVIYFKENADGSYRWALISSGAPKQTFPDGCTAKQGLWIFSRAPTLSAADLAEAKGVLRSLGYTLSQLKPVKQEGCKYEGANLKL